MLMFSSIAVRALLAAAVVFLAGCATLPGHDPLQVMVAGIEPLQGEGMEVRMLVKLRVQNPNDAAIDYNGVAVNLAVQGTSFASGVSDEAGTVPRFGETVIAVPVTVSMLRMVRQFMGMMDGEPVEKITYSLDGKLSGALFNTQRFHASGDFKMPRGAVDGTGNDSQ
jgi:LEA14-like dessication related protein